MKKNVGLKIAIVALVAALLATCCFGAVTFARYIATADGQGATNTARAAKWGVVVEATGAANGFQTAYYDAEDKALVASANATDAVIAPGVENVPMSSIAISGKAEVATEIQYTGDFEIGDNWMASGVFYCPLTVKVGDVTISGKSFNNAAAFEEAVEAEINSGEYAHLADPNVELSAGASAVFVSWPNSDADQDCLNDTALGEAAQAGENVPTVSVTLNAKVRQEIGTVVYN